MIREIAVTFGSEDVINRIKEKYPDKKLQTYTSLNNENHVMMLDYSGEMSVFESPVQYEVLSHIGTDLWQGFISFITLDLDADQQKIFDARVNKLMSDILPNGMKSMYSMNAHHNINERVLLTTWDSASEYELWRKDNNLLMPEIYKNTPSFSSHEATYRAV
ncbi:monooxygenase [Lentilactobacillus sp. Marseille-Q4993]|uniref:monooxygenase n=1 Tax=Lentilactobacillus sp. Marseille-Q4993 TaxID=3039492 RepID=UPI0024BCB296|nr:monooxygenase [Lentilactobacillus sp. Marseille-Q4993]